MNLMRELLEKFDRFKIHDLKEPAHSEVTKLDSPEAIAAVITSKASEMLAAYKASPRRYLFRGVNVSDVVGAAWNKSSPAFMITGIRQNRNPVEMADDRHAFLHKAYTQLGLKATRRNSIFCSCDENVADDWGTTYIVFVKDGWNATVFDGVKTDYVFYELEDLDFSTAKERDDSIKRIKKLKPRNVNSASDLAKVLKQRYADVIVTGDSFIGLKVNDADTNEVLKLLGLVRP